MSDRSSGSGRRRRRWVFGPASFDEGSWSLKIGSNVVALEAKPSELLLELLLRPGEAVSKEELLDAVWPGVNVVEASLSVAVSKLRKALGDEAGTIIRTIPRIGYMLAVPVSVESLDTPLAPRFAFSPGDSVPNRTQWELVEALGATGANDVWRARHRKTGQTRVFKFADTPDRLRSLKREASLFRLLSAVIGEDGPFVQLLEWNFETAPYFLESQDGGHNLLGWANAQAGLAQIAWDRRLAVARAIARALAQVHDVGVLHKDLKPANILIEEEPDDGGGVDFRIRLADFGDGQVVDAALFDAYAITGLPIEPLDMSRDPAGTALYRAPELAGGALPTARSDIYALGLILYQLVAGDFRRTLAPGWEQEVADPLLRQDIAEAAAGDPAQRIASASELAERLERLDERRAEAEAAEETNRRLQALKADADRRKQRQPWVLAVATAAGLGLLATTASTIVALRQRDEARHQEAMARASFGFLTEDLIGRVDPSRSTSAEESISEAARRASDEINRRFPDNPIVAGRLYATMARAFDLRSDYDTARKNYDLADRQYARAGAEGANERSFVRLQRATMEALTTQPGSLELARAIIKAKSDKELDGEARVWLAQARGMEALVDNRIAEAAGYFREGADMAAAMPERFSERQALNMRQREGFTHLRLGDGEAAERILKSISARFTTLYGADHPDTLLLRMNLGQSLMVQKRNDAAIAQFTELLPMFEKRFGPDHRLTMQLLAARQQALGQAQRYDEAVGDGLRVLKIAEAKGGPLTFHAIAARVDVASNQCRAGDTISGIPNARLALQHAKAGQSGGGPALTQAVQAILADCLIFAGQIAEAEPLLAGIDRESVGTLVGDADWGANIDLALADIAIRRGDRAAAAKLLASAAPAFADAAKDPFQSKRLQRLRQAAGLS